MTLTPDPTPDNINNQPPATPPCGLKPTATCRAKSETAHIYTAELTGQPLPITLTSTVVAGNQPDQCFGC
jgi:hypothetical protein